MNVRIKKAKSGQYHWRVKSDNNRTIAIGGETFHREKSAMASFMNLAQGIRDMTNNEYIEFVGGLLHKATP